VFFNLQQLIINFATGTSLVNKDEYIKNNSMLSY